VTRPLRLAIASSGLGHVSRGIEAWADDLAAALHARGESVILCKGAGEAARPFERVVPCWTRERSATRRLLKLLPRRMSWRFGLGSGYGVEQTTFILNLIPLLRREKIDILHVQDPQVALLAQRARRMGLIRARSILAHGTEEPPEFLKRIQYLQHLAPWHLEQAKAAGVWKPTWTAIPNFIDMERFSPRQSLRLREELGIPPNGLVVLTAAAIKRHHKRIDHLLAEFAQLRRSVPELPAYLVVAGGWENDTDGLIAEGTKLLGDRVRFLVRFPRSRMPELYGAADVFALCSLFEMMPIALIEAAASGLPCIVNRHPILEWMSGPGGVPIDMAAPGALATNLGGLLSDSARRSELGRAARAHCIENFSRGAVVEQILSYYRRVVEYSPASATA
jgi:glycosyltransferase involved in cell wall biosynthesis